MASNSATRAFGIGSIVDEVLEHVPGESLLGLRSVSRQVSSAANRQLFKHAVASVQVDDAGNSTTVVTPLVAGRLVRLDMSPRLVEPPQEDDKRYLEAIRVLDIRNADTPILKAIARHRRFLCNLRVVRVYPSPQRYSRPRRRKLKSTLNPDSLQSLPYKRAPIIGRKVIYFPTPRLTVPCLLRTVEAREVTINIDLNAMNTESAERMADYMPRCPLAIGLSPRLVVIFSPRSPDQPRLSPEFAHQILGRLAWHLRTFAHDDTVMGVDFPIKREAMPRFTIAGLECVADATGHIAPFYELRSYLVNEFSSRFSCVGCPLPATCPGASAIPPSQAAQHVLDFELYDDYMNSISEDNQRLETVDGRRTQERTRH